MREALTDDKRREVARSMRDSVKGKTECELLSINRSSVAIRLLISYVVFGDKKYHDGVDLINRLADLIEPSDGFDLDTVQRVCFERMEGCDEPEWTLYATIYVAIARYKRGESGPASVSRRTCRPLVADDGAGAWGVYCSECGYRFAGPYSDRDLLRRMAARRDIMPRYCSSCGAWVVVG